MHEHELPLLYNVLVTDLQELLAGWGVPPGSVKWAGAIVGTIVVTLAMLLLAYAATWLLNTLLRKVSLTTVTHLDDNLLQQHTPGYVGRIIPLVVAFNLIPSVFADFPWAIKAVERLFAIFFVVLAIRIIRSAMRAGIDTLKAMDKYSGKPLESYAQVISLVLYLIGGLALVSLLTGHSVLTFLATMGAASAVLLLIFKDTILGFVASVQISANDMVHIGDWIAVPKYGADGDVAEINLTTVKVTNFDKTVTMVPTYALIADSFQNFRDMQRAGARRIKRSIQIKMSSIRHLTADELERLKRVELLRDHITAAQQEIAAHNDQLGVDKAMAVNGRNLTNVGLFRKYMELYALQNPGIRQDMVRMVRQLQPDQHGLPLELYCFSSDVKFLGYEQLQADLFDHLLAAVPTFGLEVFEAPASDDLRAIAKDLSLRQA